MGRDTGGVEEGGVLGSGAFGRRRRFLSRRQELGEELLLGLVVRVGHGKCREGGWSEAELGQ